MERPLIHLLVKMCNLEGEPRDHCCMGSTELFLSISLINLLRNLQSYQVNLRAMPRRPATAAATFPMPHPILQLEDIPEEVGMIRNKTMKTMIMKVALRYQVKKKWVVKHGTIERKSTQWRMMKGKMKALRNEKKRRNHMLSQWKMDWMGNHGEGEEEEPCEEDPAEEEERNHVRKMKRIQLRKRKEKMELMKRGVRRSKMRNRGKREEQEEDELVEPEEHPRMRITKKCPSRKPLPRLRQNHHQPRQRHKPRPQPALQPTWQIFKHLSLIIWLGAKNNFGG